MMARPTPAVVAAPVAVFAFEPLGPALQMVEQRCPEASAVLRMDPLQPFPGRAKRAFLAQHLKKPRGVEYLIGGDIPVEHRLVDRLHRQGVALLAVAQRRLGVLLRGDVAHRADQANRLSGLVLYSDAAIEHPDMIAALAPNAILALEPAGLALEVRANGIPVAASIVGMEAFVPFLRSELAAAEPGDLSEARRDVELAVDHVPIVNAFGSSARDQGVALFARPQRGLDGAGLGHVLIDERQASPRDRATEEAQGASVRRALLHATSWKPAGQPPRELAHARAHLGVRVPRAEVAALGVEPQNSLKRCARAA